MHTLAPETVIRDGEDRDVRVHRPTTLEAALALKRDADEETKVVAGGTALMLMMRNGLLFPEQLVSLERVSGLEYVAIEEQQVRLGGLTTLRSMERDAALGAVLPTLVQALGFVANHRVRNRATIAGNVCEADYASDPPAILVTLGAAIRLRSQTGERLVPVRDFLVDYYETAIAPDELAVEVVIPRPAPRTRTHYVKYVSRTAEDRPCVGIAASLTIGQDGRCEAVDVQIAGATATPFGVPEVLAACRGGRADEDAWMKVAAAYASTIEPIDDVRGSAEYRRRVIERLVHRTLRQLADGTKNGASRL